VNSGQAIKLFQITPNVNGFQTFNNPAGPVPDSLRCLEKLVLPSILTQVFHLGWCETCRVI